MSSSTAWDNGIRAAPHSPCIKRANTICGKDCATPQSMDATVKPATEYKNTFLRPIRPASQPLNGVMIAAATMYEVSTHAI